jgi:hypothetical protein
LRTLTPYLIAAAALTLAACGGDDNSLTNCNAPAACSSKPTIVASSSTACGSASSCPTSKPACSSSTPPAPVNAGSGVTELKLGPHVVGDVVSFNVPSGTPGFSIVSQAMSAQQTVTFQGVQISNVVVPDKVTDPAGNLIYDDFASSPADPSGQLAFYATDSPWTGAFTIPNTSGMLSRSPKELASGTWKFTVNDYARECIGNAQCGGTGSSSGEYDVRVLLRSASATSGLNVGLYLVGGTLKAANAPNDAGIKQMVSTLSTLYGAQGLCVNTVTVYDVPSWAATAYGTLSVDDTSPCSDLNQMFTLSVPGNQLNFFLVSSLTASSNTGKQQVVGIDGTIPGPSGYGGTIHSGAAVSAENLEAGIANCTSTPNFTRCGADETAYIAAHEGGHWLGLYHTTERFGDSFDTLADTPKCPCSSCAPTTSSDGNDRAHCTSTSAPTTVDDSMCLASSSCGGAENMMFWLLTTSSRGTLSCQQGAVMRDNPAVQ